MHKSEMGVRVELLKADLCCAVLVYGEMVAIIYGDYIVWQFIGIRKNVPSKVVLFPCTRNPI